MRSLPRASDLSEPAFAPATSCNLDIPARRWDDIQQTIALVRETRPDDIGVSVSYPLPNTRFYERVQRDLGRKRNWSDSDDLCVMFTAAYTDQFYRAMRDALHAEVDSWNAQEPSVNRRACACGRQVNRLEPSSRNATPPILREESATDSGDGFRGLRFSEGAAVACREV